MLKISKSPINRSLAVGFTLEFSNGWTVSIQFGDHNYCNNSVNLKSLFASEVHGAILEDVKCINAEVAAWDSNEEWYDFGSDTVKGYLDADEVSDFIHMIRNLEENYNDTVQKEPIDR